MFFVNEVDNVLFTLPTRPLTHTVIINVLKPSVSSKVLANRRVSQVRRSSLQSLCVSPTKHCCCVFHRQHLHKIKEETFAYFSHAHVEKQKTHRFQTRVATPVWTGPGWTRSRSWSRPSAALWSSRWERKQTPAPATRDLQGNTTHWLRAKNRKRRQYMRWLACGLLCCGLKKRKRLVRLALVAPKGVSSKVHSEKFYS